jgi:hypothetical protein
MSHLQQEINEIFTRIKDTGRAMKASGVTSTEGMPNWNTFIFSIVKLSRNNDLCSNFTDRKVINDFLKAKAEVQEHLGATHDKLEALEACITDLQNSIDTINHPSPSPK